MGNLTFQEDLHEYRLDGVTIPSVTQVLQATGLSDVSKIPAAILDRASLFGKAVHKAVELDTKGTLDYESLDESLIPYLNGWKAFVEDFNYKCVSIEYRTHHPLYRYGATIDQIGLIGLGKYAGEAIGDIKSGVPQPSHKYQLSAYKMALKGTNFNTFILYLNPEFKPRGYKVIFANNNKQEQSVFLSALTIYNVRKKEGLL